MIGAAISYGQWNECGCKKLLFLIRSITGSRALVVNDTTDFDTSNLSSNGIRQRLNCG